MSMKGCNNHPKVTAALNCAHCHKPVCQKCIVAGRFCSPECQGKFGAFYFKYKGNPPKTSSGLARFLGSIVGIVILGGGAYFILKFIGVLK